MREAFAASHIFSRKNIGKFQIFNEVLTKDVVSFEQPGPDICSLILWWKFILNVTYLDILLLNNFDMALGLLIFHIIS